MVPANRSNPYALAQGLIEYRDGPVDLVAVCGQGRRYSEYTAHRAPTDVKARPQLQAALADSHPNVRCRCPGPAIGHQFDAKQQAAPSDIADNRVALLKVAKLGFQIIPKLAGVVCQAVSNDNLHDLASDRRGERIGGMCGVKKEVLVIAKRMAAEGTISLGGPGGEEMV